MIISPTARIAPITALRCSKARRASAHRWLGSVRRWSVLMANPCRAESTVTAFWPVGRRQSCDPFHSGDKNSFVSPARGKRRAPYWRSCDGTKRTGCDEHVQCRRLRVFYLSLASDDKRNLNVLAIQVGASIRALTLGRE